MEKLSLGWHLEGREFHDRRTGRGVDIHRYDGGSAARQELLVIAEIVVIAFDCEPFLQVERYPAITPPEFVGSLVIPPLLVCLLKNPKP